MFTKENSYWIFEPKQYTISKDKVEIITDPETDFWQRTYYGFQNDNAPSLLMKVDQDFFSFTVKTEFESGARFDQCGVVIYQDSDNWFKASSEYENETYQRIGSVVTNKGYSDWATTDIPADIKTIWYRLSRRSSDFMIEYSYDGKDFKQIRIFHLFEASSSVNMGIYACSPLKASFKAIFSEMVLGDCVWQAHE